MDISVIVRLVSIPVDNLYLVQGRSIPLDISVTGILLDTYLLYSLERRRLCGISAPDRADRHIVAETTKKKTPHLWVTDTTFLCVAKVLVPFLG